MKKFNTVIFIIAVMIVGWLWLQSRQATPSHQQDTGQEGFNKQQHSLDDPVSLWVVVNKQRPLRPKNYEPADLVVPQIPLRLTSGDKKEEMRLREPAATALLEMYKAAQKDGLELMVSSAYRSYEYQQNLYNFYVSKQGQSEADTQSARPGHSEHQTGLAVDIEPASRKCEVEACFGDLPEGKWVAANGHKYGFVLRYPEGQQGVTGYIYEPWHLRYVGKELATELHKQGNPTLEKYFNLPAAPDYL